MKKNIVLLLALAFLFQGCSQKEPQIPREDREKIESFFSYIFKTEAAYTLWGDKPMSVVNYWKNRMDSFETSLLEEGWTAWKKHEKAFPSDFVLVKTLHQLYGKESWEIQVINKSRVREIFEKNRAFFDEQLKQKYNPDEFVAALTDDKGFNEQINNEVLGVLLGFGKENAAYFKKYAEGYKASILYTQEGLDRNREVFADRQTFDLSGSYPLLDNVFPPNFVFFPSDESEKLFDSYSQTRERILQVYKNTNFFDVTMKRWMAKT